MLRLYGTHMDTIRRSYCKGQVLPNFQGFAPEGAILLPLFTRLLMAHSGAIKDCHNEVNT